ncbi:hypothetical protein PHLCEN_2v1344 [Hermanssonia centrifuga]|uniref:Uncharacterized protein n=1 Tax=Hermanssonia centrifuga TaxID=98765 RepID=A0A2R6S3E1_9APHY|nr:hypothetical protein PHLCEN_2v1344 [Hermanssonia centrifuga]
MLDAQDEIERKVLVEAEPRDPTITISSPRAKPSPANKLKRSTKTRSVPSTPSKPKSKRACRSPSPSQPSITSFFPLSPSKVATDEEMQESGETNMRPVTPVSDLPESRRTYPPLPRFKLHLSDTKTRSHATLPREEDTLPARLQLMLYHRLLANLLETPSCSQALDFDELWIRLGVSPSLPFSATFREQTGLPMQGPRRDRVGCLSDLVRMWRNAVEMIYVEDLGPALTVVYRTQPRKSRKGKDKGKGKAKSASRHQEDQDIAETVAPTKDQEPGIDNEYQGPSHAGAENTDSAEHNPIIVDPGGSSNGIDTNDAAPSNFGDIFTPSVPEEDVDLQWAIQQSLLEQIQANPELNETLVSAESAEQQQQDTDDEDAGCASEQSTVIGTKTFQLDDVLLDDYLTNVLDWWHGRRAPRGVDIELTKRCL